MSFWDERYADEQYIYGTAPNRWLAARAGLIRPAGKILSLGEGEGRNAVWLAGQGYAVDAMDGSSVALDKARKLAGRAGVAPRFHLADLRSYQPAVASYDAVVLIFVHMPPPMRAEVHRRAEAALVPGGALIIEAFTPAQLGRPSGGPSQVELLYRPETIRSDFPGLEWIELRAEQVELDEGPLHRGPACVVRGVGRRRP